MYIAVYISSLKEIHRQNTTYLSELPNEIFQLVIDFFRNDIKECSDTNDILDYIRKQRNIEDGSIISINNTYQIENIECFFVDNDGILIQTSKFIYIIFDDYDDDYYYRNTNIEQRMDSIIRDYANFYGSFDIELYINLMSIERINIELPIVLRRKYKIDYNTELN